MEEVDQFSVDSDNFSEAIYLDQFLKTTNIEEVLEKKRQIERQLNRSLKERDKVLAELEFQIVNGNKKLNKLKNDSIKLKSESKLLGGEYQELFNLDKPYLIAFNKYMKEYKLIESKTKISFMHKIPLMINHAMENKDITKALLLASNVFSASSNPNYPKEVEDICSQLSQSVIEIERNIMQHIIDGLYIPVDSLYQHLSSLNLNLHKSQVLHILNHLNWLMYLLKIIQNSNNESLLDSSSLHLDTLNSLLDFISNYKISCDNICISCIVRVHNVGDFDLLFDKFSFDNENLSNICIKCQLSPLFTKLIPMYKSKEVTRLIFRAKSLDLKEFNYCLITESLRSFNVGFNSELESISEFITSNFDLFTGDSYSFGPIFESLKKSIDTVNDLYNWVNGFTSIDSKLVFLNVCYNFINKVIKLFCHIIFYQSSLDDDDGNLEGALAGFNFSDSLFKNGVIFNPFINSKYASIEANSLDSKSNKFYIFKTDVKFLHVSLKLIMALKTLLLPQIIDYMNTIFDHFDSKLKDINLYDFLSIKSECKHCKDLHVEIIPFDNPKDSIFLVSKFLISEIILSLSMESAQELSRRITSISIVQSRDLKTLNHKIQDDIGNVVEVFKRRLSAMVDLLQVIPINDNPTFSFDKQIQSHKMYINIDPIVNDRHRLVEYHIYLVILQLIECLRSEYINSSVLLDNISMELAKTSIEFLASNKITLSRSICELWYSITDSIYRNKHI